VKIVLDPIYTLDPEHCASNAKMKKVVDYLLSQRDDLFFYWLIPDDLTEDEAAGLLVSDHIEYHEYTRSKDRMREYLRVDREYESLMYFGGRLWDADLIITTRTTIVPLLKIMAIRPSSPSLLWTKKIFLMEDMPMMPFKKHVGISHPEATTLQVLAGYDVADYIAIAAFWEKAYILREAKKYLSPSRVRKLRDKMVESSAALSSDICFKTKTVLAQRVKGTRPFTISFLGRMTHNMRAEEIFDLMTKQWVFRGGDNKVDCIATTQSINSGCVDIPDFVNVKRLPREEFWDTTKNKIDVFLFMCEDVDYPMSVIESLSLGCPGVILKCRWSVPTLGEDYPFFVSNMREAYGMITAFYTDYVSMYAKFITWVTTSFEPMIKERDRTWPPYLVESALKDIDADIHNYLTTSGAVGNNPVTGEILKYVDDLGLDEFYLFEVVAHLDKVGIFNGLGLKTKDDFADKVRRAWGTQWNIYKLGLYYAGWVDASPAAGHYRRSKDV